ncbi:MAG: pyruvate dehydrogenase (acetyl-transferring), homodimeric type, partial [Lysobacterales bacterium]
RQVGIYAPLGQMYEPEDLGSMLYYREEKSGQILEVGISEAGAISSWIAAATSYSSHDLPMLPCYIYYSMFGWQRVGDLIWAAADQRARGFLLGATSGRTTLGGEGLQHQDGASHLGFATVPNCRAYDPAYAYEIAIIMQRGIEEMLAEQSDVFYYLTVGNENYAQPSMPEGVREGVLRGMYRLPGPGTRDAGPGEGTKSKAESLASTGSPVPGPGSRHQVQLLASGAILSQALQAAELLAEFGVDAHLWSVTSWTELQRDGIECERRSRVAFDADAALPHVTEQLAASHGPVIAASDYVRALPELIRAFVPRRYITLGTDGFGRSDTRAGLRDFFEIDARAIAFAAIKALADDGEYSRQALAAAAVTLGWAERSVDAPWVR